MRKTARNSKQLIKAKFEAHFVKKRNVVFERAKFNLRKQEEGEAIDTFITSLYQLSEHCAYGDLRDDLIRDRIVIGVRDKKLSMKLQRLTLEKAITAARQQEYVKQEQALLKQDSGITGESVDLLQSNRPRFKKAYNDKKVGRPIATNPAGPKCTRCSKGPPHPKHSCPAITATCHRCQKVGHYQEFCRTKLVAEVCSDSDSDNEMTFLGAVGDPQGDSKPWMVYH